MKIESYTEFQNKRKGGGWTEDFNIIENIKDYHINPPFVNVVNVFSSLNYENYICSNRHSFKKDNRYAIGVWNVIYKKRKMNYDYPLVIESLNIDVTPLISEELVIKTKPFFIKQF